MVPKKNSVGIVAKPKLAITMAPQTGDAVLAAIMAKEYTKPQGIIPFSIPKEKKLTNDFDLINLPNNF